jgi:hypothetical protein
MSHKRLLARRIIRRAIQDLASSNPNLLRHAEAYIISAHFMHHCEEAEYPYGLLDTLNAMVRRSKVERVFLSKEVIRVLSDEWEPENK